MSVDFSKADDSKELAEATKTVEDICRKAYEKHELNNMHEYPDMLKKLHEVVFKIKPPYNGMHDDKDILWSAAMDIIAKMRGQSDGPYIIWSNR